MRVGRETTRILGQRDQNTRVLPLRLTHIYLAWATYRLGLEEINLGNITSELKYIFVYVPICVCVYECEHLYSTVFLKNAKGKILNLKPFLSQSKEISSWKELCLANALGYNSTAPCKRTSLKSWWKLVRNVEKN